MLTALVARKLRRVRWDMGEFAFVILKGMAE
jgi:hypothetical protein